MSTEERRIIDERAKVIFRSFMDNFDDCRCTCGWPEGDHAPECRLEFYRDRAKGSAEAQIFDERSAQ